MVGTLVVVIGLTVVGWFSVIAIVVPNHYSLGASGIFSIGLGLSAYALGIRLAPDADHIAAIDNTTRKLVSECKRPRSFGFWFSLGHSAIVFLLALLLSLGLKALVGPVKNDDSGLHHFTGIIGTSVSGGSLYVIAGTNVVILGASSRSSDKCARASSTRKPSRSSSTTAAS